MGDRLSGKVALITGGARGQGEAEARLFANEGARVFIADVRVEQGRKLAAEIGEPAEFIELDVGDESQWSAAIERILDEAGRIDVLVNNAAMTLIRPAAETTPQEFQDQIRVNQMGPFLGMRAVFPAMVKQGGGSIINICSMAAIYGMEGQFAYSGTKAAVRTMGKVAAREWGPLGIRVNSILPGAIDTPMLRGPHTADLDIDEMLSGLPIGRAGEPREIANAVLFLASDESSYVTGTDIAIDGGLTACTSLPPPRQRQ